MRRIFVLSILIGFVIVCSCQKQDSTAEAQLAQRKTELDAREEAVIQREKAMEEREKAVANIRVLQSQRQAPDAAQAEVERQKRIQQLPPELRALIPDRSGANAASADRNRATDRQRPVRTQPSLEDTRRKKMLAIPAPQTGVPQTEATSLPTSPTPE